MGEKKTQKIYVVGHKNPDTDSICSAIAYANLKRILTGEVYKEKRAGEVNGETKYVLEKFGVEVPGYLDNVLLQVQDMNITEIKGLESKDSIKEAWDLMKETSAKTLPILRDEKIEGLITVGDIAKSYMDVHDSSTLAIANTSYSNMARTLDGEVIVGDPSSCFTEGKVTIAASNPEQMEAFIEKGDLVIVGDRHESQLYALEIGAKCLVICTGANISEELLEIAKEKEAVLIRTSYDTFTVARLINQSIPVKFFMTKNNIETFRLTDYIDDVREVMTKTKFRDFPVTDKQGRFCGFISRARLLTTHKKQVILVDHNEISQAVSGIEEAEVVEIIDHHRLGSMETVGPVFFRNQPVGCTATIIYQMYVENGVPVDKTIAGLLCSAIISDTLLFRSPTCTALDKEIAEKLAVIAEIEMEEHAKEMFNAGSALHGKTVEEICYQDYKIFNANDTIFGVGQISSMNESELDTVREPMAEYIQDAKNNQKVDMIFMVLTNILEESSEIIVSDEVARNTIIEAFHLPEDSERLILKGVVSRKKQLIPVLVEYLQQK